MTKLLLTLANRAVAYKAYMPFIQDGGIFVPTTIHFKLGDKVLRIINVHNAALTFLGVRRVVEFLELSRIRDCASPMESSSLLIGDLNFMALGDRRFKAGRPVAASLRVPATTSSCFHNVWMRELKLWIEISQPVPTN